MKRNLLPLLGVAFFAAVAATGIFYGLLLPRLGNSGAKPSPVAKTTTPDPAARLQPGMRAVAIHPSQSGGVVSLLSPGSRVDIVVLERPKLGESPSLFRLMEDVEVLATGRSNDVARSEITVLASVADAERLLLADFSQQIRLVLRNPADRQNPSQAVVQRP